MCLFIIVLVGGPRLGGLIWWLFEPDRWDSAFSSFVWPILGLILAPWTTLMFVAVAPFGNVSGYDWIWLAFGAAADLFSYLSQGYGGRSKMYAQSN